MGNRSLIWAAQILLKLCCVMQINLELIEAGALSFSLLYHKNLAERDFYWNSRLIFQEIISHCFISSSIVTAFEWNERVDLKPPAKINGTVHLPLDETIKLYNFNKYSIQVNFHIHGCFFINLI